MLRFMKHLILMAVLAGTPAHASPDEAVLDAGLLPGWATDDGSYMAALSLTLAPGWKTYWRAPGEAGIPPQFDWSASENLRTVQYHWPTPQVFHLSGMQSIGYLDGVVLPIEVTAKDPSQPIILRATVDIGVCHDICVPATLTLNATLTGPGQSDPSIKAALRDQPKPGRDVGLARISCAIDPTDDGLRVTAAMTLPSLGPDETVIFEPGQDDIWVSTATITRDGGTLTAEADLVAPSGAPFALDRSAMRVTVIGARGAMDVQGCPAD
jgi:DsbC/DsbD-like thiol-disulfide interchange protein